MNFVQKRVKEIRDKQSTFGTPDPEQLEPMLNDIKSGNYRELVFAYTSKDGIQALFSTKHPHELINALIKMTDDLK